MPEESAPTKTVASAICTKNVDLERMSRSECSPRNGVATTRAPPGSGTSSKSSTSMTVKPMALR
jgi:hypothetical protein